MTIILRRKRGGGEVQEHSLHAYARRESKSKVQAGSLIDSHGRQISGDKDIVSHLNE